MAEFTEVMRQARRMCNSFGHECSAVCPLDVGNPSNPGTYGDLCIAVGGGCEEAYKLIEERVMQWASEHKAPDEWRKYYYSAEWAGFYYCPKCRKVVAERFNFCPGCGQKMEADDNAK